MTASLSVSPGSQPYCLVVKGDGPQQQHAVSPASARIEKHRPSMLHQDTSRFGSVSSLPPYEALYGAARSAQEVLPILDADPEEAEGPLDQTGLLLVPTPGTPQVSIHSIDDDAELELDDSIQLDRLVLRSSLALAAAQSLLAGTLSVRGAILDLNTRDVEGDAGLERIEVETRIRMRRDAEQAATLDPLLRDVSAALDGFEDPSVLSGLKTAASKSSILSRRLEVGRGSVGELSATRVEAEWTIRRLSEVDDTDLPTPRSNSQSVYSLGSPTRETASGPRSDAPTSPLAARARAVQGQGRSVPIVVHPVASTSSSSPLRWSTSSTGPAALSEPLSSPQLPVVDVKQEADPLPSTYAEPVAPTTPSKQAMKASRPPPATPDPPQRKADPSPARPRAGQHTRSLSAFLPSLALPSLAGSSTAEPPGPGTGVDGTSSSALAAPAEASSPAINRLKALDASPSPSPPQPATKSWGWFASSSPFT